MLKRVLCLCLTVCLILGLLMMAPAAQAASDMKVSDAGIAFIKFYEGFRSQPYKEPNGRYSIGYGTECPADKVEYYMSNPMTEEEAENEVRKVAVAFESSINRFIDKHGITYTQNQFDGLFSMCYNVGTAYLSTGETLIAALCNPDDINGVINAFVIYSLSGGKRTYGHLNRRLAEAICRRV